MKWSDGEPYTTEDVRFWYEDFFQDPEAPVTTGQNHWKSGGEVAKPEVVDQQVFKIHCAAPSGFFAQQIAWAHIECLDV